MVISSIVVVNCFFIILIFQHKNENKLSARLSPKSRILNKNQKIMEKGEGVMKRGFFICRMGAKK